MLNCRRNTVIANIFIIFVGMFADQIINCSNNNDVDKDDGCSAHDGPDQPGRAGQPRPESAAVRPAPGGAPVRRGRARPGARGRGHKRGHQGTDGVMAGPEVQQGPHSQGRGSLQHL